MTLELHASDLRQLSDCPMQFYFRKTIGPVPPAIAMVVGSATHASIEHDMKTKLETNMLADLAVCQDKARDVIVARFSDGVTIDEEDRGRPVETLRGEAVDTAVALAKVHHEVLAPTIQPTAVERPCVLKFEELNLELHCKIDLMEADCVRDTKTASRKPPQKDADESQQLTTYALTAKVLDGSIPKRLCLDALVKTKTPKAATLWTSRDEMDLEVLVRRIGIYVKMVNSGIFIPCDSGHWRCSEIRCGYWARCPYVKHPVSVVKEV